MEEEKDINNTDEEAQMTYFASLSSKKSKQSARNHGKGTQSHQEIQQGRLNASRKRRQTKEPARTSEDESAPFEGETAGAFSGRQAEWGKTPVPPGYENVGTGAGADSQKAGPSNVSSEAPSDQNQGRVSKKLESLGRTKGLRSEQKANENLLSRMKQFDRQKQMQVMKRGQKLGKVLRASADKGHAFPYIFIIGVSLFNDFGDILDFSVAIGIDQLIDLIAAMSIFATRMFLRSSPNWFIIRGIIFVLELLPGIGFLPFWTTAAVLDYRAFKKAKRKAYDLQSAEAQASKEESAENRRAREQQREESLQERYQDSNAVA